MRSEASESDKKTWAVLKCLYALVSNLASEIFASLSNIAAGLTKILERLGLIDLERIICLWPERIRVQPTQIERPETLLEGWYAGGLGSLQVFVGCVVAVAAYPIARAREIGYVGLFSGTLEGVLSLVSGAAVAVLVLVTAVAAGISTALRHRSTTPRARPPRVFPPHLMVSPYALHAAHAMSLLQESTKKSLVASSLQSAVAAFPLTSLRHIRSRTQQGAMGDKRFAGNDYLMITSDLLVFLLDGEAQWVCRREDIERCTVQVPAFLDGAFRAQQDLLLRRRERKSPETPCAGWQHAIRQKDQPSHFSGSSYRVHIVARNKLRLPNEVLHDFAAAYKAYVNHAAAKRSVVRAFRKRLGLRESTRDHSLRLSTRAIERDDTGQLASNQCSLTSDVKEVAALGDNYETKVQEKLEAWKGGAFESQNREMPTSVSCCFSFSWLWSHAICCKRRRRSGRAASYHGSAASPFSMMRWDRLISSKEVPSCPPETVHLSIGAPDNATALRIFDVICCIVDDNTSLNSTAVPRSPHDR